MVDLVEKQVNMQRWTCCFSLWLLFMTLNLGGETQITLIQKLRAIWPASQALMQFVPPEIKLLVTRSCVYI